MVSRRLPNRGTRFADLLPSPVGRLLDAALDRLEKVTQGNPQVHADTHLQGASDPLATPATPVASVINVASSSGTGTRYALDTHKHELNLGMTKKGSLLSHTGAAYATVDPDLSTPANGDVLTWDTGQAQNMKWAAPSGGGGSSDEAMALAFFMGD